MLDIYFAHHVTDYDTPREAAAIRLLEQHGFAVVNPNSNEHDAGYKQHGMEYFLGIVATCDALAFQRFETGQIGAGVGKEIKAASERDLPIYEVVGDMLPHTDAGLLGDDVLSVEATRALLRAIRENRN